MKWFLSFHVSFFLKNANFIVRSLGSGEHRDSRLGETRASLMQAFSWQSSARLLVAMIAKGQAFSFGQRTWKGKPEENKTKVRAG
jgi:hypothetical protein